MLCLSNFLRSEQGAVTVDWVILTSGLVFLGIAVAVVVSNGIENLSGDMTTAMSEDTRYSTQFGSIGTLRARNQRNAAQTTTP